MRKYYLVKVIYKDKNLFLIWYSDSEDGFLLSGKELLIFVNIDEAKSFAQKHDFLLETEISVYDFSNTIELINSIQFSENCNALLSMWNFFSDLSKTLNEVFIGDSDEGLTVDIYNKLFYGSNLKVLKGDDIEYHPTFDYEETKMCVSIFQNGLYMLDKYIFNNQ